MTRTCALCASREAQMERLEREVLELWFSTGRERTRRGCVSHITMPSDDVTCADCGWLGHWRDTYRVKYPNDRRPSPREQGFYLCVRCWDRLCGAAFMEALR